MFYLLFLLGTPILLPSPIGASPESCTGGICRSGNCPMEAWRKSADILLRTEGPNLIRPKRSVVLVAVLASLFNKYVVSWIIPSLILNELCKNLSLEDHIINCFKMTMLKRRPSCKLPKPMRNSAMFANDVISIAVSKFSAEARDIVQLRFKEFSAKVKDLPPLENDLLGTEPFVSLSLLQEAGLIELDPAMIPDVFREEQRELVGRGGPQAQREAEQRKGPGWTEWWAQLGHVLKKPGQLLEHLVGETLKRRGIDYESEQLSGAEEEKLLEMEQKADRNREGLSGGNGSEEGLRGGPVAQTRAKRQILWALASFFTYNFIRRLALRVVARNLNISQFLKRCFGALLSERRFKCNVPERFKHEQEFLRQSIKALLQELSAEAIRQIRMKYEMFKLRFPMPLTKGKQMAAHEKLSRFLEFTFSGINFSERQKIQLDAALSEEEQAEVRLASRVELYEDDGGRGRGLF